MVKEFQNLFIITLQMYSAIINGAIDTVPEFQSALYIIYHDFKLEFQYHRAIKMWGVSMEYLCFMKQSNKQCGWSFCRNAKF